MFFQLGVELGHHVGGGVAVGDGLFGQGVDFSLELLEFLGIGDIGGLEDGDLVLRIAQLEHGVAQGFAQFGGNVLFGFRGGKRPGGGEQQGEKEKREGDSGFHQNLVWRSN